MIKCKECKFWDKNDVVVSDLPKGDYGSCSSDGFNYQIAIGDRKDMLIYADYEGYSAGFMTGEEFGCIHGELK